MKTISEKVKKVSGQDQHFTKQALQLAHTAKNAYEEAIQFAEGIDNKELRKLVLAEIEDLF